MPWRSEIDPNFNASAEADSWLSDEQAALLRGQFAPSKDVLRGAAAPAGLTYQGVSTPDSMQARALFDAQGTQVGQEEFAWHNPKLGWSGTSAAAPGEEGNVRFSAAPLGADWHKMTINTSDFMDPGLALMLAAAGATSGLGMAGYGSMGQTIPGVANAGIAGSGTAGAFAPGSFWDGATASSAMSDAGAGGWNSFNASNPGFGGNWASTVDVTGQLPLNSFPGQAASMAGLGATLGLGGAAAGGAASGAAGSAAGGLLGGAGSLLGAGLGAGLGMLGGGSKPAGNITTVQDIPEWQKPFVMQSLMGAQGLYNSMDKSTPLLGPAQAEMGKTISGQYLMPGANPYLDATFNQAAKGVTDQYLNTVQPRTDALFNGPGSMGKNTAFQQMTARNQYGLGDNLSNLATNIYGGNYQTERGRQFGAAGAAPQFTNDQASAQFAPHNAYGALVSKPFGQSQTSPYFDNKAGSIFGGALTGAAIGRLF